MAQSTSLDAFNEMKHERDVARERLDKAFHKYHTFRAIAFELAKHLSEEKLESLKSAIAQDEVLYRLIFID